MARGRRIGWVWAGLSALLYVLLLSQRNLPGQATLNAVYFLLQGYGWWCWGVQPAGPALAKKLSWSGWTLGILATAIVGAATRSLDWALAGGSLYAQGLTAHRYRECWLWWIVLDVSAAALYLSSHLYLTAALYGVYTWIAVLGYRQWQNVVVVGGDVERQDAVEDGGR